MHARPADIAKYKGKYDAGYTPIRQARLEKMQKLGLIDRSWQVSPQFGDWDKVQRKEWEARCMEVYAAMIDNMDQGIGRLLGALRANGQLENTLILYLQDNGACAETIGRNPARREGKGPRPCQVQPTRGSVTAKRGPMFQARPSASTNTSCTKAASARR